MVLNTFTTTTPSSHRPIITEAKAALVTTGGTIGSNQETKDGSIDVVAGGKNFLDREISEALIQSSINVTNTHPAYNILSENIDTSYVIKLAETLTRIINRETRICIRRRSKSGRW